MERKTNYYYGKSTAYTEAFRNLATNIEYAQIDKKLKLLVVTSPNPSEGKTNISINLARHFALNGNRVALVDCDLRNPSVGKRLGLENNIGLTNLVLRKVSLEDARLKDEETSLDIILSGPIPPNPSQILGSANMKDVLKELASTYDYAILDTPPIGIISDAAILSNIADGTILVVSQNETRIQEIKLAQDKIDHVGGNLLGLVLNKVDIRRRGSSYYYGYY